MGRETLVHRFLCVILFFLVESFPLVVPTSSAKVNFPFVSFGEISCVTYGETPNGAPNVYEYNGTEGSLEMSP